MDEEDILSNYCADLVSKTKLEPALVHLFRSRAVAAWVRVDELYRIAGVEREGIKPELVATRLPSPDGDPNGAVILFFDSESMWSMTAWYNIGRLSESHPLTAAG